MTVEQLLILAHDAGSGGSSWADWTLSDAVQDFIAGDMYGAMSTEEQDALLTKLRAEFDGGNHQHRLSNGWVARWTTAPADYDSMGTEELPTPDASALYFGKRVRRVLIDGHHLNYQADRYGSGLHPTWEEDPRVLEVQRQAKLQQELAEQRAHEEKRAAGLVWLKALTLDQLQAVIDDDGEFIDGAALPSRGLHYADARAELRARKEATAREARAAEWARCRAILPDGCTLVDDGESRTGRLGRIHRPPHVYYDVQVMGTGLPDPDPDKHRVTSSTGDVPGGLLADVVERIEKGQLRLAKPDEVPPRAVTVRLGHDFAKDVRRYEIDGRAVWVGRERLIWGLQVLDIDGRRVRKKAIVEEATRRFANREIA